MRYLSHKIQSAQHDLSPCGTHASEPHHISDRAMMRSQRNQFRGTGRTVEGVDHNKLA